MCVQLLIISFFQFFREKFHNQKILYTTVIKLCPTSKSYQIFISYVTNYFYNLLKFQKQNLTNLVKFLYIYKKKHNLMAQLKHILCSYCFASN